MGGIAPPLILSIYFSCKEAVKELLKRGSNVNQLSNDGSLAEFYKDTEYLKNLEIEINKVLTLAAAGRKEGGMIGDDVEQYTIDRRNKLLDF